MVSAGSVTVHADRERCCGSGNCVSVLPDVFDQDSQGLVVVRQPVQPGSARREIVEAILLCPVQAIRIDPSHLGGGDPLVGG
jgi:ferredoxin